MLTTRPSRLDSHRPLRSPRHHVDEDRDDEQHDAEADEAARCTRSPGVGDALPSPGEEVRCDLRARTDRQRHRDRLAHGAAEAEHHRADDAAPHAREDGGAQHLPAGRAHAERGVLVLLRDCRERLTAECGDDRRDHDGENQPGCHEPAAAAHRRSEEAAEERSPPTESAIVRYFGPIHGASTRMPYCRRRQTGSRKQIDHEIVGFCSRRDAISVVNKAMPRLTGTAITIAISAV